MQGKGSVTSEPATRVAVTVMARWAEIACKLGGLNDSSLTEGEKRCIKEMGPQKKLSLEFWFQLTRWQGLMLTKDLVKRLAGLRMFLALQAAQWRAIIYIFALLHFLKLWATLIANRTQNYLNFNWGNFTVINHDLSFSRTRLPRPKCLRDCPLYGQKIWL